MHCLIKRYSIASPKKLIFCAVIAIALVRFYSLNWNKTWSASVIENSSAEGMSSLNSRKMSPISQSDAFMGNETLVEFIKSNNVRYLDFGASNGGSTKWLGGWTNRAGVSGKVAGVDIDSKKVDDCKSSGQLCVLADITKYSGDNHPIVDGVTIFHVLEHVGTPLNNMDIRDLPLSRRRSSRGLFYDTERPSAAQKVWQAASLLPKSFIYFRGPSFDNERYLRSKKFVTYFQQWHGHTCHLNSSNLAEAMVSARSTTFQIIILLNRILNSSHSSILVRSNPDPRCGDDSACDLHPYPSNSEGSYHPKPDPPILFESPLYAEMRALSIFDTRMSVSSASMVLDIAKAITKGESASCITMCRSSNTDCGNKEACLGELFKAARNVLYNASAFTPSTINVKLGSAVKSNVLFKCA